MRIVFVNLQENSFYVRTLRDMIFGRKRVAKHAFLLKWLLDNNIEVVDYITPNYNALPTSFLRLITQNDIIQKEIAKYILKKSGFAASKIQFIMDEMKIESDDIVIYYGTFDQVQFETISNIRGIKVVDQIHFYGNKETADLLKDKGITYYMFEVDLNKYSKLYQINYFWFKGKYIERPYAYEDRFVNKNPFNERKNKVVAMGTLTKCFFPELEAVYGPYYQPRRKMIMDHASEMIDILDSYISEYYEVPLKKINEKDNIIIKIYKKLFNLTRVGKQKQYFSFNMVDKYNEYKMFICPEDVNGSYGIGTIEGMACGCAMIGWNYGAFEDMGMVAGKHYISYNGTIEDLKEKIKYYQMEEHQGELERIARTGCEYVRNNYSQKKVAERYYNNLELISEGKL